MPSPLGRTSFKPHAVYLVVGDLTRSDFAQIVEEGCIVVPDIGAHIHPASVRTLIASYRQNADHFALRFVLTTHSMYVINEFKGYESDVFVPTASGSWEPLDRARDVDWLAHFSLGDLYERNDFDPR